MVHDIDSVSIAKFPAINCSVSVGSLNHVANSI